MHSNKNKKRNKITLMTKVLRDADLFDEKCGDSLTLLLYAKIKCPKWSLNSLEYDKSDEYIVEITKEKYYDDIKSKINIDEDFPVFKSEQQRAIDKYRDRKSGKEAMRRAAKAWEEIMALSEKSGPLNINIEI